MTCPTCCTYFLVAVALPTTHAAHGDFPPWPVHLWENFNVPFFAHQRSGEFIPYIASLSNNSFQGKLKINIMSTPSSLAIFSKLLLHIFFTWKYLSLFKCHLLSTFTPESSCLLFMLYLCKCLYRYIYYVYVICACIIIYICSSGKCMPVKDRLFFTYSYCCLYINEDNL